VDITDHERRVQVTNDDQLMAAVRGGNTAAFETLFERYREPVWRFFRRRVVTAAAAEELAQDAFVALLESAARYESRGQFRAYLFGIAYNVLHADRRSRSHAMLPLETEPAALPLDPDTGLWVRQAIQRLDPDEREVLMLREYEQLSYMEIAEVRRTPINTVRSRLFRARLALKAALERTTNAVQ
jgi:RNA polymerase sigma-70 factor (ECF subfamily)